MSDTDIYPSDPSEGMERIDEMRDRKWYREFFTEQLDYEILQEIRPEEQEELKEILELLVDTCSLRRNTIRIGGEDRPAEVVRACLMKLNDQHIQYVLDAMQKNTTEIRNIRQYLLTALYNAPMTMNNYFASWAARDTASL